MNPQRKARLVYRATTLFARLPWPLLRGFAHALAWAWIRGNARESRVTRRNLEIAYPDLLPAQREDLHQAILRTTARQALETLRIVVRSGLFQQGGVLALDRAGIGIRRQAKDIPASHVQCNSVDNRAHITCFTG